MPTTYGYATALEFNEFIDEVRTVPAFVTGQDPTEEVVFTGDGSTTEYYLDQIGVIENTLTLTISGGADLTSATDYSVDLETSKITLTASGVETASGEEVLAAYKYNTYGVDGGNPFTNARVIDLLNKAEDRVNSITNTIFVDSTTGNPAYEQINDELLEGREWKRLRVYDTLRQPLVKLQTTTAATAASGASTVTLTSASGFPNSATIYIGGNKIAYTAKSGNEITVPTLTAEISTGAKVRGEVVEISREAEGNEPSYRVLDPDTEYKIDYDTGRIELLQNAFFLERSDNDRLLPENLIVRNTYMSAWHDTGMDPEIPEDIREATLMFAARKLLDRAMKKAQVGGRNQYDDTAIRYSDDELKSLLENYRVMNIAPVGPGKQRVS